MQQPNRLANVERSGIRRIMDRARGRSDVLRLEIGEPDFDTPPHIVEAAARAGRDGHTRYAPGAGIPDLRAAASEKLARVNEVDASPETIVITAGAINGILTALVALTSPGDGIAIPDPAWPNYVNIARSLGLRVVRYPLDPSTGFGIEPAAVAEAVHHGGGAGVIVLNSPSNPTGSMCDVDTVTGLLDLCGEVGAVLLSDECYDEIVFEDPHISPASMDHGAPVVSVFSLSKTYAMTGWRVGYVTGPGELMEPIARVQEIWNSCCNTIAQIAGVAALTGDQRCVAEMVTAYRERRATAMEALERCHLPSWRPSGAFYTMVDVSTPDSDVFAERLVDDYAVAVAPGKTFGAVSTRMVRISLASTPATIVEGIGRIATAVREGTG